MSEKRNRRVAAGFAIAVIVAATVWMLHLEGRLWTCACGEVYPWAGDIRSSHNSQHLLDPYAFTHLLHGFVFFWLLGLIAPRLWPAWQFTLAMLIEAAWEVLENAPLIIERYRAATISLGYAGDTVVNSAGDMLLCGLGFWLARSLGFRWSLVVFFLVELALVVWIRDSLLLNVIMLLYPLEAIKTWQLG